MVRYEFESDVVKIIAKSGNVYIADIEDYENISKHSWWECGKILSTEIDGKCISLSKFVLGIFSNGKKVMRYNKNQFDCRKSNLYYGNIFHDRGDYYEVETFSGDCFLIDKSDKALIDQHPWVVGVQGYVTAKIDTHTTVKLHRFLLGLKKEDKIEVDHINRNPKDNRRSNLRLVDRSQNMFNTGLSNRNKSGYKGVYWHTAGKRWAAQIKNRKESIYLGLFETPDAANAARENKLREMGL